MRIAVGGILHETNTFADGLTELDHFVKPGAFPGLLRDQEILDTLRGSRMCVGGYIDMAERLTMKLVPLIWTFAQPSATVRHAVYEDLKERFLEHLREALPVDGVLLDLHGAMVTDRCEDVEGDLLRTVRQIVGPRVPVMATLDFHANITPVMAEQADALIGYDTYPHVDNFERGQEAARWMAAAVTGRVEPVVALRAVDMLIGLPKQCTLSGPMAEAFDLVHQLEARPGILAITLAGGFPFADYHAGVSVTVMADGNLDLARRTADEIARYLWERGEAFRVTLTPVNEAIAYALKTGRGPVVLADVSDNPGGGSPCDGTQMLQELVRASVPSAVLAVIVDLEAVRAAQAAGIGQTATLVVGGKTDRRHGDPLTLTRIHLIVRKAEINKNIIKKALNNTMNKFIMSPLVYGDPTFKSAFSRSSTINRSMSPPSSTKTSLSKSTYSVRPLQAYPVFLTITPPSAGISPCVDDGKQVYAPMAQRTDRMKTMIVRTMTQDSSFILPPGVSR